MDFLRYFKVTFEDPHMVEEIQKFFGVSYKSNAQKVASKEAQNSEETTIFQRRKSLQHSGSYHEIKENSQTNEISSFEDESQEPKLNDESADPKSAKNYIVKNKFWYYLFFFGTYLGDDVGYAISIPFLFWNFDAIVARKLVLVWTIIMYAGEKFVRPCVQYAFTRYRR